MRSESEIRQKLKQVLFRYRKKKIDAVFRKTPDTCRHNATLEPRDGYGAGGVRACFHTVDGVPRGVVCDIRYDNGLRARGCPLWEPRGNKEAENSRFRRILESGNMGLVAKEFPDAAALMWVLNEDSVTVEDDLISASSEPVSKGWDWSRWPWSKDSGS